MRILHVSPFVSQRMGGIPRAAMDLCRTLGQRGHEVALYSTNADWNQDLNVPLGQPVDCGSYHTHYFQVRLPRRLMYSPTLARALKKELPRFDIVHIHSLYRHSSTIAAALCRAHRVPYVLSIHNILSPWVRYEKQLVKTLYEWAFDRRMVEDAAAVLFNSAQEWEDARRYMNFPHGIVIPNGVHPEDFAQLPPRFVAEQHWPQIANKCVIVFMARIARIKGLDRLLDALPGLLRRGHSLHLLIAGADDAGYLQVVRQQVSRLSLGPYVTFTGHVEGEIKRALLARADIFALTSYSESFGIAPVEAMAAGVPVIVTQAVKMADIIREAGAGRSIAGTPKEILNALDELLSDPVERQACGARAARVAREQFDWAQIGQQVETLYDGILAHGPHPHAT